MPSYHWNSDQIEKIKTLYLENKFSLEKIRIAIGAGTRSSIKTVLIKEGVPIRGKTKISGDQYAIIKKLYLTDRLSITDISKKYGVSDTSIRDILIKENVSLRPAADANRKITDLQISEFIRRYKAGESTNDIARDNDCTHTTVAKYLRRAGIIVRDRQELKSKVRLTKSQLIINDYLAGIPMTRLAEKHGCVMATIRNILLDNETKLRTKSEAFGFPPTEKHPEICKRYKNGETLSDLGRAFKVEHNTIKKVLKIYDVDIRGLSLARAIPPDSHAEVCRRYKNGENVHAIANDFKRSKESVYKVLELYDIPTDYRSNYVVPISDHEIVGNRYVNGESIERIAFDYEVSAGSISRILRRLKIVVRANDSGGADTVNSLINGEYRFSSIDETDFYVYSLVNQSEHIKLGIAYNHLLRKKDSKGKYDKALLVQRYASRHHAFVIEQAILEETRNFSHFPDCLAGWDGFTEVRRMTFESAEEIFIFYDTELDCMGIWDFAVKYVPMTDDERNRILSQSILDHSISNI